MNQHPTYELFEVLGRGTNTVVYRGYDLTLGREVAIKELDESGRRDPRLRERFLREAQFLAQFEHENVLRVYAVDTERGWIIMELMKGTLASIIAAGASEPDLVRSVLKQTLEALAFLHEKNKVHGTVRPTNLLINEAGRVKLSEFEQTAVGGELRAPRGSKKYLAPELIRPEFGDFGPPLDLYCLGFTALELLKGPQFDSLFPGTGKGAIDADIAWLRWHSSPEALPPTRQLAKGIPDDLAGVLDHMLKKHVAERPQTAQEVLKALADRPLVPVPVTGVALENAAKSSGERPFTPTTVRTIAAPQTSLLPQGASPLTAGEHTSSAGGATAGAKVSRATKPQKAITSNAPPFSKDWWNQQLGRPYILYPLCALILLAALWFSFRLNTSQKTIDTLIPVTFHIEPDATGLQITEDDKPITATAEGTYAFTPGPHTLTFRKEGFHPLTGNYNVSAEKHKFTVRLQPVVKQIDVVLKVMPAGARVSVDGQLVTLIEGAYTHRLQAGQPFLVEARHDGYEPLSRSFSPLELATLDHQITLEMQPLKPTLPTALIAKPGAPLDPDVRLPVRALASKFADEDALEFALVKPGIYSFGSPDIQRPEGELPQRSVHIEQPFYIATHEITNAQYRRFFDAEGESQAGSRWQRASRKWAEPLKLDPINNNLPVTNVSVEQAQAFCRWLGGRLPTEMEWEIAVRGPQDSGFPLPWGNGEPTRERCRIFDPLPEHKLGPVPVDQLAAGASPLGLMHTIGNAAEWCADSQQQRQFILRGCSFATANINEVRLTWRGRERAQGAEDTGFRPLIPVTLQTAGTAEKPAPAAEPSHESSPQPQASLYAPLHLLFWLVMNRFGQ